MKIIKVHPSSPLLRNVIKLGDKARETLGFLPREAFQDYARKEQILAAVDQDQLLGYILFRRGNSVVTIVQLCVDARHRKAGVAKKLVDELFETHRYLYHTIKLSCRRDYGLDEFWRALDFVPISERVGRATRTESTLTVWIRTDPDVTDLITSVSLNDAKKKIVLDTNIVIDLCSGSSPETDALLQPFMSDYVSYFISQESFQEINKMDDKATRNEQREFVKQHFETIQAFDRALFDSVKVDLLSLKDTSASTNTGRDISHIAYSISFGADAFITRDNGWLNNSYSDYIFDTYGLMILSPGELVKAIDEILSPNNYAPVQLLGLSLQYAEMKPELYGATVDALYPVYNGGKKNIFEQDLRRWMADTQNYHLELMQSNDEVAGLIVYSSNQGSSVKHVYSILVNPKVIKPQWYFTFIKRMIFRLLEDAQAEGITTVKISKRNLCKEAIEALKSCLFIDYDSYLIKTLVRDIIKMSDAANEVGVPQNYINKLMQSLSNDEISDELRARALTVIEKIFWPLKIDEETIPCFIIPIQARYAMDLFDENLYHINPCLFENTKIEAALSPENVYFKNSKKRILQAPARILWYVSADRALYGTKMIRACSYLDSVEVDTVNNLYKKYRRLGVLSRNEMLKLGSDNRIITAYRFSYTELFKEPICLQDARRILGKQYTFQSAIEISRKSFFQIYKQGCKL